MTAYQEIRCHQLADARQIELHRPESLNAWTPDMGRELLDALRDATRDETVRAVLITGAGRAFSAGADVKSPRETTATGAPDLGVRLREIYNPVITAVRTAPKPMVAAIHGACAGLGASLALACDLLLASTDAYILLAFTRIGVMPDGGVLSFLAERVGVSRATELAMLAEKLPVERAREWGLVNRVYAPDDLHANAVALTERLAAGPTIAYASTKKALTGAQGRPLADQLELEASLQLRHGVTADYAEGRAAFVEKRPPRFEGR